MKIFEAQCDVIKICQKRRDATRSKIRYKLHLKFGNSSFKVGRSTPVLIFMTSHMPLYSVSSCGTPARCHRYILLLLCHMSDINSWRMKNALAEKRHNSLQYKLRTFRQMLCMHLVCCHWFGVKRVSSPPHTFHDNR